MNLKKLLIPCKMTILDSAFVDVLSLFQGATMLDNKVPNRKLKHERERRGLSQQRLAEILGTSFESSTVLKKL